jgi:DNA-binding response OmpR family regulator
VVHTILLVEDAKDLAAIIQRELSQAGFDAHLAPDGLRALELHASLRPAVVILDWMLPKLDGIDVLRQIRQTAATPVIMLTARGEEMARIRGLEAGADDYLTKPFSMQELIARVRALIRRVEMIQQMMEADRADQRDALTHGPLRLDPRAHYTTANGEPVDLSPTEFDLLHLLLRNPGRAFSRAYLLDTIWGADYLGGDRSVDSAILRLRKKLGSAAEDIETVWGVGYRLRRE